MCTHFLFPNLFSIEHLHKKWESLGFRAYSFGTHRTIAFIMEYSFIKLASLVSKGDHFVQRGVMV